MKDLIMDTGVWLSEALPDGSEGGGTPCPWAESPLTQPAALTGWAPGNGPLHVLIDLAGACRLDSLELIVPDHDPREWQIGSVAVLVQEPDAADFRIAAKWYPPAGGEGGTYRLAFPAEPVGLVRLDIKRNRYKRCPLPKLAVTGTRLATGEALSPEQAQAAWSREPRYLDRYGQVDYLDWPGKIRSDAMLEAQRDAEARRLTRVEPDRERYDAYGGWKAMARREATGFFRVEKIDGRWWFVTPAGYPFILKGVDLVTIQEKSHYTPLYEPGTTRVRRVFAQLPDRTAYPDAYTVDKGIPVINYLCANLRRKYGPRYEKDWAWTTTRRLIDWDFNTAAKWDTHPDIHMPYVYSLREGESHRKIKWSLDPFDPGFEDAIAEELGDQLTTRKDDPWLVGYHFTNEAGWDRYIVEEVLRSDAGLPAKQAFTDYLRRICGDDLAAACGRLGVTVASWEALTAQAIPLSALPPEWMDGFIRLASQRYFTGVRRVIRRYDPHHLFLGSALTPGWRSSPAWETGGAADIDVLSFDTYDGHGGQWLEPYLALDKPIVNLEFSFTASDRGHDPLFAHMHCGSQQERGERYRDYVRGMFAYPCFIGTGFFILYDQPPSGRNNGDGTSGECHNFGLVDTQDQPYEAFVRLVRETNRTLEEVHAGLRPERIPSKEAFS